MCEICENPLTCIHMICASFCMCIIFQLEILEVSFGKTSVIHGILDAGIEFRKDVKKALASHG